MVIASRGTHRHIRKRPDPKHKMSDRINPYLAIFLSALSVRLVVLFIHQMGDPAFEVEDSQLYLSYIGLWWDAGLLGIEGHQIEKIATTRMPLYFLFVDLVAAFPVDLKTGIVAIQCGLDAGTCVVIAAMGKLILGRSGMLIAGLLAAIWPNLVIHSSLILTDTLFVFFWTGALYAVLRYLKDFDLRSILAAGLLIGVATLIRTGAIWLLPVAALAIAGMTVLRGHSGLKAVAAISIFLSVSLATVSPILVRNAVLFDTLQTSAQTGTHSLFWIIPAVRQINGDPASHDEISIELEGLYQSALAERDLSESDLNPFERSDMRNEVAGNILAETSPSQLAWAWFVGMAINSGAPAIVIDPMVRDHISVSFAQSEAEGPVARIADLFSQADSIFLIFLVLSCLGALAASLLQLGGLVALWRADPWITAILFGIVLYWLFLTGPVLSPKYRLPAEPILILWAAAALCPFWSRLRSGNSQEEGV